MHTTGTKQSTSRKKTHSPGADPGREAWTLLLQMLQAQQGSMLAVWSEFGVSSSQGELLCSLEPKQSTPMVALARTLHCHDSNVTGLVDKLERRRLIERCGDPRDRRVKLIVLTAGGERLREQLLSRIYEPLPFIKALSVPDKSELRNILRRASERTRSGSQDATAGRSDLRPYKLKTR